VTTPREKQIAEVMDTRRRQIEDELEHQRFDVRVQRGEWPTAKVGELFGVDVYHVDGSAPVLALMAMKHGAAVFYESRLLGRPIDTAQDLMVECQLTWVECHMQFFVSTAGWKKLRRSIQSMSKRELEANNGEPERTPLPTDYVAAPLGTAKNDAGPGDMVGIDLGTGKAIVTMPDGTSFEAEVEIQ
jgi:hypothetical protein